MVPGHGRGGSKDCVGDTRGHVLVADHRMQEDSQLQRGQQTLGEQVKADV